MKAVFALPYAFGSASAYRQFKKYLDKNIYFRSIEYPGHSSRFSEPLCTSIRQMAVDAYDQISDVIKECSQYMIIGYSMGSLVGFELYQYIMQSHKKPPSCLIVFASPAPDRIFNYKRYEDYGVNEIREELREKEGTPDEILNNQEMLELFMPIIKSDLIALRDYHPDDKLCKIQCKTVVVRGTEEENKYCSEEWSRFCDSECDFYLMKGGHFFMFENESEAKKCAELINKMSN